MVARISSFRCHFKKKGPCSVSGARAQGKFGGDLLSHGGNPAVPSALESLTAVFGMGTGVASPPSPPKAGYPRNHVRQPIRPACPKSFIRWIVVKPHGRLLPVS